MNLEGFNTLTRDGVKHHSMHHIAHNMQLRSIPSSGTCYGGLYGFRAGTLSEYTSTCPCRKLETSTTSSHIVQTAEYSSNYYLRKKKKFKNSIVLY